jgi:hypothetical protein
MPLTRLRSLQLSAGSVTSDKVKNLTITSEDLAPGTFNGAVFIDGSIPSTKFDLTSFPGQGLALGLGNKFDVDPDNISIEITAGKVSTTSLVTKKGNIFNGPSQLVCLLPDGKLPALDGSNLTGLSAGSAAGSDGAIQFNSSGAFAADSSKLFWDDANDRLGIGTPAPTSTVHILGSLRIEDGSQSVGRVWTSDASGLGSWQSAASGNFADIEEPTGVINGTNDTFVLDSTPVPGSVHLYLNGVLQFPGVGEDFVISGTVITMTSAPPTGARLTASYRIS